MKKIVSIWMALILLLILPVFPSSAAERGTLQLIGAESKPGETVKVSVNLNSNPGLITMRFAISWGNDLELVSVDDTGLLKGWTTPAPSIRSPYTMRWTDSLATTNNTATGKIATLTFKIKDNAIVGDKNITLTFNESWNTSGKKNVFNDTKTTIHVTCKKHSYKGAEQEKCNVCGKVTGVKNFQLSQTSYIYDGKAKTPSVVVKDAEGKTVASKDYTVKYDSGRTNVGKYKVTITMKGDYTGTKTLTFQINPATTSVQKLVANKGSLKVKIKKKTIQITGYEIQYSTSKKFKAAKTKTKIVKKYKKTSVTISKLKAKKNYYVRVRTYKTVSGEKYYSGWSSYKAKKTK